MTYAKKIIITLLFVLGSYMYYTSCTSTPNRVNSNVIEYQREIDRLESELSNRDRAIESGINRLEIVAARSSGMEEEIDELIELFDEYQRTVEQMLYNYRRAEFNLGPEDGYY